MSGRKIPTNWFRHVEPAGIVSFPIFWGCLPTLGFAPQIVTTHAPAALLPLAEQLAQHQVKGYKYFGRGPRFPYFQINGMKIFASVVNDGVLGPPYQAGNTLRGHSNT